MVPWATFATLLPQLALVVAVVVGTIVLTVRGRTKLMADAQAEYDSTLEKSKAVWKERAETCEETLATVRADRDYLKRRAEDLDLENHSLKTRLTNTQLQLTRALDTTVDAARGDPTTARRDHRDALHDPRLGGA